MTGENSIMVHPFSDVSQVSTLCFVCFLKQYFRYQVHVKGKADYRGIRRAIMEPLRDVSPTYIIACLCDLVYIIAPFGQQPTPMFTIALMGLAKLNPKFSHDNGGRRLAANLFSDLILSGPFLANDVLLGTLVHIFEFRVEELREELQQVAVRFDSERLKELKTFILKQIKSRHFCTATAIIKRVGFACKDFLDPIVAAGQIQVAEAWATFNLTESDMISCFVMCCRRRNLLKVAVNMVYKNKLSSEFPDVIYELKDRKMTKFAETGRWHEAYFAGTVKKKDDKNGNVQKRLFQRLQKLALDIGGAELDQLLERRSLKEETGSFSLKEETGSLKLQDIGFSENDVILINTESRLLEALRHFSQDEVDVIGIDTEWVKCEVSLLQIATAKKVLIFDMINLFNTQPSALDMCLKAVFHSSSILKLGYSLKLDLKQLSRSYEKLECFQKCEGPTLDMQKAFASVKGGLSGLAKAILGGYLSKSMQLSDWGLRPLSDSQLHYAALDAAVLVAIYQKECRNPSLSLSAGSKKDMETLEEPTSASSTGSTGKPIETLDFE